MKFNFGFSHGVKLLQTQELSATLPPMSDVPERVRLRLRDEMTRRHLSQQDVADTLKWTQSRVAQKLTGRTPITLEELEALCFGVGLPPTEAVRDHGLEFCAEMTPSELRLLERMRQLTPPQRDAILTVLDVATKTRIEPRHAKSSTKILKKRRPA